jgi:hypothetical protein
MLALLATPAAQDQPRRFQSGVEITTVDVMVVDGDGRPVLNLQPGDFAVEVDGRRRRIVSAEWVPLTPKAPASPEAAPGARTAEAPRRVPAPEPYTSNLTPAGGRLIVLFIDRGNIRFEGMVASPWRD